MLDFYYSNANSIIKFKHKKNTESVKWDFHLHDYYEIYFLLNGETDYFIEKNFYYLSSGDLVIIRNNEIHAHRLRNNPDYDRFLICFDPNIAKYLSSPKLNLLNCFTERPSGERNKIVLSPNQREELIKLFYKFESLTNDTLGADILKLSYFLEVLTIINDAFLQNTNNTESVNVPKIILPIIKYIEENINEDLSLSTLEKKFFVNRFYLTRLFKKSTGLPLHKYIVLKRISKAKELLSEGFEVINACDMTGFNDYTNFIKMFKRITSISPSYYRKTSMKSN